MTGLFIQFEMVKVMSATESLLYTASKIFGKSEDKGQGIGSVAEAQAFAAMVNSSGG